MQVEELIRSKTYSVEHVQDAHAFDDHWSNQESAPKLPILQMIGEIDAVADQVVVQVDDRVPIRTESLTARVDLPAPGSPSNAIKDALDARRCSTTSVIE